MCHEYVLSRQAQLKYGYVSSLLKSVFENIHYLDDDWAKISEYAKNIANRFHPEVLPFLLRKSCEYFEVSIDDLIKRRAVTFVNAIFEELKPDFSDKKWGIINILNDYPISSSLFLSSPINWSKLPSQAQDMCFGLLIEPIKKDGTITNPTISRIKKLKSLKDSNCLGPKQLERMGVVLQKVSYLTLSSAQIDLLDLVPRMIIDLESHNWYKQNPASDALANYGMTSISFLDSEMQVELGRNILQAAQGGAGSAISFIDDIKEKMISVDFARGLLLECFTNEKSEFRLKCSMLKNVLGIILNQPNKKDILNEAKCEIDKSSEVILTNSHKYSEAIEIIKSFKVKGDKNYDSFSELEESISSVRERTVALLNTYEI